jgi:hypothetical protein
LSIGNGFIGHDENLYAVFRAENGGTRSQELILHSAGSDVIEITPEGEIKKELTTEDTEEHGGKSTAG